LSVFNFLLQGPLCLASLVGHVHALSAVMFSSKCFMNKQHENAAALGYRVINESWMWCRYFGSNINVT